jgi:spore coat polysaccharide biosynthesis protein SpsF (cytidylyltransferase family)
MKTVAIIQARMQSTRLPGKVLADLNGKPALYRVVERAECAKTLDAVVVATSTEPADDVLERLCNEYNIECFRGSENDVLDRYYRAALKFQAEVIVRLTADCPLLDPQVIDRVVSAFGKDQYDYVSNNIECTYPNGLDTEVIRFEALEQAWQEARLKSEREHVTPYITKNPHIFHLSNVTNDEDFSALRWTVDEPEDLEFVQAVYKGCPEGKYTMDVVLNLLQENPHLIEINKKFKRNEGYAKSLREDGYINTTEVK